MMDKNVLITEEIFEIHKLFKNVKFLDDKNNGLSPYETLAETQNSESYDEK